MAGIEKEKGGRIGKEKEEEDERLKAEKEKRERRERERQKRWVERAARDRSV